MFLLIILIFAVQEKEENARLRDAGRRKLPAEGAGPDQSPLRASQPLEGSHHEVRRRLFVRLDSCSLVFFFSRIVPIIYSFHFESL